MMNVTRRSQIPGTRFIPTEAELINNYLRRRVERNKSSRYIFDMDVYEKEPWLLTHVSNRKWNENEWFYFVKRKKLAGIKKFNSKRPSRTVGAFTWKSNYPNPVVDKDGVTVGGCSKENLSLVYTVDKKKKTTGWVMDEFLLDNPGFQEVALCRIRFHPRNNNAHFSPRLQHRVEKPPREATHQDTEQHQDFASCGQQNQKDGHASQVSVTNQTTGELYYGQGYGNMAEYQNETGPSQVSMMNQPLETPMYQSMIGSCSGVSYSIAQDKHIMVQDSNYYPMNRVMEKQQAFAYNYGFGDMVPHEYQNYTEQDRGPSHVPVMNVGQDMVPMTQGIMAHHQKQYLDAQPTNGGMEQNQHHFRSCGNELMGESLGLGQQQNKILEQTTYHSLRKEQFGGQITINHYFSNQVVPYSAQSYQQQDTPQSYSQGDFAQHRRHVLSPTTTKNQAMEPPCLPQEHAQEQAMDFPMNQSFDEDIFYTDDQEMDFEITLSDFGSKEWIQTLGQNSQEEEAELDALRNCDTLDSFLDYFVPLPKVHP